MSAGGSSAEQPEHGRRDIAKGAATSRRGASPPVTATKGTGLVVWAVWGPPVAGSIIISQLP